MPRGVYVRTEQMRATISDTMRGRTPWNKGLTKETDECVARIAAVNVGHGHPCSIETRAAISAACLGRPGPNKGKSPSLETRAKISINNGSHRPEVRDKIGASLRGRTYKHVCGTTGGYCRKCQPETGTTIRYRADQQRVKYWGCSWLMQRSGRWHVRFPWANRWVRLAWVNWIRARGPIPVGHVIHHVNNDKLDDGFENLACLTQSEHNRVRKPAPCQRNTVDPERMVCNEPAIVDVYRRDDGRCLRLCSECARELTRRRLVTRLSGPRRSKWSVNPSALPANPCPYD